jgi:hypothetical protein
VQVGEGRPLARPERFALGQRHYRRSEQSWDEAGRPRAAVTLTPHASSLAVEVDVASPHPSFVPAGRENPLDNERAEINGDGVQLYVRPEVAPVLPGEVHGWLLVPEAATDEVRVIALTPPAARVGPTARWRRTADGYALTISIPRALLGASGASFGFDLIVNESAPGRERRRGQLVLSGARGEFVYLQGDRHDPERFLRFRLAP